MVAQNTDELIRELDRTQGAPVQFEHPQTHARYVLIPQADYQRVRPLLEPTKPANGEEAVEWNEEKNARRFHLIDLEIAGTITPEQFVELERLQYEVCAYRDRVAPLPWNGLEKLHAELLEKAARAEGLR
jgi:hypothetical protein